MWQKIFDIIHSQVTGALFLLRGMDILHPPDCVNPKKLFCEWEESCFRINDDGVHLQLQK